MTALIKACSNENIELFQLLINNFKDIINDRIF